MDQIYFQESSSLSTDLSICCLFGRFQTPILQIYSNTDFWPFGPRNILLRATSLFHPEPFFSRTRKLPCIFAALFVCYSSRLRLRDSLLRPCYDFLLFFTTQTRPVHRETDSGDEKFITPINKIHNPILGYAQSICYEV